MVWLRRCTHYLFIVVVAVNSTLLTINSGDYIFYTDWAWTSFVVFSIANTLMTVVGAVYYITFTGVPGTGAYYGLIMQVYTWGRQSGMVCTWLSCRFHRSSNVDSIMHVVGFGILGYEEE